MKKKFFGVVTAIAIAATVAFSMNINSDTNELSALTMNNIEALASGESGAACPSGCKDIGWGTSKILECDCNYDHFSSCNSWGC